MKVITKKSIIDGVPSRYKIQYPNNFQFYDGKWSDDTLRLLKKENPLTEKRVVEIIGNDTWTKNTCTECSSDCEITVLLGEDPDYDSSTVKICVDCLNQATAMAQHYIHTNNQGANG